ncbi:MAG: hypothetical protein ACK5JO_09810 [Halodesulfovibrio sp.]
MLVIYTAKIVSIDSDDENDLSINIDGCVLRCFCNYTPYVVVEGEVYNVEISLFFNDDIDMNISSKSVGVYNISYYKHLIVGHCVNGCVCSDIKFCDEYFKSWFGMYDEKLVEIVVDRIDVAFL